MFDYAAKFPAGLSYNEFLTHHGTDEQRKRWNDWYPQVKLTDAQKSLLGSFKRKMPLVVLAGAWCGDCGGYGRGLCGIAFRLERQPGGRSR